MVRSKFRICLFRFFLLFQIVAACLWASQAVALASLPTDIERDLEEVKLIHHAELQFLAQFESQSLEDIGNVGETQCELCGRDQLLDAEVNLTPASSVALAKADLKSDLPPSPRRFLKNESGLTGAVSSQSKADSTKAPVLDSANVAQIEVPAYHQQVFNRRDFWMEVSEFVIAQRNSINETAGITERQAEGFCLWVVERIDASQIKIANVDSSLSNAASSSIEVNHSLAAIDTVEIPMFLIPRYEDSNSARHSLTQSNLAMPIPMFLVEDVEDTIPDDLFVNENQSAVSFSGSSSSITLPGPARDPCWQYYEDCDRWGVLIVQPQQLPENTANSVFENQAESTGEIENDNPSVALGAGALLHQIIETNSKLLWSYSLSPQRNFVAEPIEQLWKELAIHNLQPQRWAVLVPEQPLSPLVASKLVGRPVLDQLGIGSLNLTGLLNGKTLSFRISELQSQYADRIVELEARSQVMRINHGNQSLGFIADQCRRWAKTLDRFADSISATTDDVALLKEKTQR